MRLFASIVFLAVAVCLSTGCLPKREISVEMYREVLSILHIRKAPADSPEEGSGICLLDPTQQIPKQVDAPKKNLDKAPSVQVPDTDHDFGDISEEGEFVHEFKVRNVGKAVLQIRKVLPG